MEVSRIGRLQPVQLNGTNSSENEKGSLDFSAFLREALQNVNQLQQESVKVSELMAAGEVDNLHDVVIAAEKAEIALQLTIQIRNKIMDAYNEIMRMEV